MKAVSTVGDAGGAAPRPRSRPDARRSDRTRMAAAQVAFRGTALDCVLVDASAKCARVFLRTLADLPDLAELRLSGGDSRPVRCRWQAGLLVGFELVGTAPVVVPAAQGRDP